MDHNLSVLIDLQKIDTEIFKLEKQANAIPEEIAVIINKLKAKEDSITETKNLIAELQKKKRTGESGLQTKEAEIDKLSLQLFEVKTNKEYSAMQSEIENRKKEKVKLEDAVLELMADIEKAEREQKQKEKELLEEKTRLETEKKIKEEENNNVRKMINDKKSARSELVKNIPNDILEKYEKLIYGFGKEGLAVVPIDFSKESCLGCYMSLPPQFINEIRLNSKLITCDKCGRFLYWEEIKS